MLFKPWLQGVYLTQVRLASTNTKSVQLLSRLRKKTGYTIGNCRAALKENNNDFAKAEEWLHAQAQKEGWAKATKLADRPMSHGLIGVIRHKNAVAMVEVNCETDFVGRNPKFQELVNTLAKDVLRNGQESGDNKIQWDRETVNKLPAFDSRNSKLDDLVAKEIGIIGENMALSRAEFLRCADKSEIIGTYVHTASPSVSEDFVCALGKFGSLVRLRQASSQASTDVLQHKILANNLAQHIVGMSPTTIGELETEEESSDEDASKKKKKKKKSKLMMDETRMLYQDYLLEDDYKVHEILDEAGLEITDFIRYACGENAKHE